MKISIVFSETLRKVFSETLRNCFVRKIFSKSLHRKNISSENFFLLSAPISEPSAPAPQAYWIVPKDPVPNIGLQFHNSKECEQLLPAVSIDEQGTSGSSQFVRGGSVMFRDPEKEARKNKSQSFCENMTEEQKKEYKDTMKFAKTGY